ncbi:MAG: SGNH/GDSL hydrolase family protein [Deltaproteobacteria bacterium]|nr:SGNH/GDSL hydrolase family protein [Deltaproteobacteria bacterium]
MTAPGRRALPTAASKLLIVVVATLATLLAAEIATRLVYSRSDLGRLISFGSAPTRTVDGVVLWDSEDLRYDRSDLRRVAQRADTFTVVGLGDSIMYGIELPKSDTYLEQARDILQRRLEQPVEMINLAVRGYNTAQEDAVKELAPQLQPDFVIVHWWGDDARRYRVVGNHVMDFGDVGPDGHVAGQALPIPAWLSERLLMYSRLYALLTQLLVARHQQSQPYDWAYVETALADIHNRAQRSGAKMVILASPSLSGPTPEALPELVELRRFGTAHGIDVIDLSEWFSGVPATEVALDSCHFNAKGHAIIAARLAEYMLADRSR